MAATDCTIPSQSPEPRGDENDALRELNVSGGDHKKWEEVTGDYEVGIINFWGIKNDNTYVSTANPGREEGRLLCSDVDMTDNKNVGVGTHVAPATQDFNPFLPLTQERVDRKTHFWNFSPPGIDKIPGAGVNKIKQLLNVNFLQRRDGVRPQQSGGGQTDNAECSPGNSFVNSWVERTRGGDPNRKCSPGNPFRNAWLESSNAGAGESTLGAYPNMECSPGYPFGNAWVESSYAGASESTCGAHPNMEFSPGYPFRNASVESSRALAEERTGGTHPNMAASLRRQEPDDSVLRMPVPIKYTELLAHRVPVKRHCPGIEATPSRYRPYKLFCSVKGGNRCSFGTPRPKWSQNSQFGDAEGVFGPPRFNFFPSPMQNGSCYQVPPEWRLDKMYKKGRVRVSPSVRTGQLDPLAVAMGELTATIGFAGEMLSGVKQSTAVACGLLDKSVHCFEEIKCKVAQLVASTHLDTAAKSGTEAAMRPVQTPVWQEPCHSDDGSSDDDRNGSLANRPPSPVEADQWQFSSAEKQNELDTMDEKGGTVTIPSELLSVLTQTTAEWARHLEDKEREKESCETQHVVNSMEDVRKTTFHSKTASNRLQFDFKEAPVFDDSKLEWRDYLSLFEMVAAWNEWTDQQKALQLAMSMSGSAQKFVLRLPADTVRSFKDLVAALTRRYEPEEREANCMAEFQSRQRQLGKSVEDFGTALQSLAAKAFPGTTADALEKMVIHQFISGMANEDMRGHVRFGRAKTLIEAISLAVEWESFKEKDKVEKTARREADTGKEEKGLDVLGVVMARLEKLESQSNSQSGRGRNRLTCFGCRQDGHFLRDCSNVVRLSQVRGQPPPVAGGRGVLNAAAPPFYASQGAARSQPIDGASTGAGSNDGSD